MDTKLFPIMLITFGAIFLLYNLGIVHFTPWQILWPSLIIWLGVNQLRQSIRRSSSSRGSASIALWLIVIAVGFYLLLPIIGITIPSLPWQIFWPLVLILIGVLKLLPGGDDMIKFGDNAEIRSAFIGEVKRGSNWVVDDTRLHHGIGTVVLDLTKAMIPDREIAIDVSGYIGEAVIYLPPGLAFRAECVLNIGEINVVGRHDSGFGKHIKFESPNYNSASQRLDIRIHWKIGEVSIHQIN